MYRPIPSTRRRKRLLALFAALAFAGLVIGLIGAFKPDAYKGSSKVGGWHDCQPGAGKRCLNCAQINLLSFRAALN